MHKILVIEDEQHLRDTIHDLLFLEGYAVELAANGKEGITKVFQVHPDLILCDVMMPEMNGHEVLSTLRASHSSVATVPFIFLTAKAEREDHRMGMELGADDYIPKPFDKREVFRAISTQLERRQKLQAEISRQVSELQSSASIALNHEYLTPMTNIKNGLELLHIYGDNLAPEQSKEIITTSLHATVRLERLIHNLLLFQKVHTGLSTKKEWLEQVAIVPSVKKVVGKISKQKNRSNFSIECEDSHIWTDTEYLMIALFEILDNACKFSSPEQNIRISGKSIGDRYVLRITDHGRGMTRQEIEQISAFKQFEREKYEQQGVGLGLFLARELTRIAFGAMTITSVVDQGTTVEFNLPITLLE